MRTVSTPLLPQSKQTNKKSKTKLKQANLVRTGRSKGVRKLEMNQERRKETLLGCWKIAEVRKKKTEDCSG